MPDVPKKKKIADYGAKPDQSGGQKSQAVRKQRFIAEEGDMVVVRKAGQTEDINKTEQGSADGK